MHSVCSVGSERTVFSESLGRSHAVPAKWCLSHAAGHKTLLYTLLRCPLRYVGEAGLRMRLQCLQQREAMQKSTLETLENLFLEWKCLVWPLFAPTYDYQIDTGLGIIFLN